MKKYFICIYVIMMFSCTHLSPQQEIIKNTLNKNIDIGMFSIVRQQREEQSFKKFRDKYKYLSIVYLEDGCTPCYPKYIKWQKNADSLCVCDNYTVLFIIEGNSYENFSRKILISEPKYDFANEKFFVVLDNNHSFLDKNSDINRWAIERTLLIDGDNKIKLVGSPLSSPKMKELFYSICTQ